EPIRQRSQSLPGLFVLFVTNECLQACTRHEHDDVFFSTAARPAKEKIVQPLFHRRPSIRKTRFIVREAPEFQATICETFQQFECGVVAMTVRNPYPMCQ